jgi:hypothetical protein
MYSRASTWILGGLGLAAVTLTIGCEGSSSSMKNTDAMAPLPGNFDTLPPPVQPGKVDGGGADAITVRVPEPPPPIGADKIKLLPKGATLVGGISVACSYGPGTTAAGARWCAFAKPGATLSTLELWVMNMSKLPAAGSLMKCDGTSPDCIKLSDKLFGGVPMGGPQFPSAHRFFGDMLIFHANAVSRPSDTYSGPIYAWTPGWPAAKKISATDAAFQCVGITRAAVALCLENVKFDATPLTFELYAGPIDGDKVVKKIATIQPAHPTTMASQWGTTFTSDGKYFIYSAATPAVPPATEQTPETLYYLETDKIGVEMPKKVGLPGIASWDVQPDYGKWFYLREYNYSQTQPSGTLFMSDFPAGTNEVKIASTKISSASVPGVIGVTDYSLVPTKVPVTTPPTLAKLAFINVIQKLSPEGRGEVISIKNPAGPLDDATNVVTLLASSPSLPFNSPDLRYGRYFDQVSTTVQGLTDSRILKYDMSAPCVLSASTTSAIFGFPFLENAGLTFWVDNYNQNSDTGDGMVGDPKDCSKKRKFSSAIDYWFVKNDEQLVYTDSVNNEVSTLKMAKIVAGDLGPEIILQTKIERKAWAVLPGQEAILFEIKSTSEAADGIYYYKVGAVAPTDGGAPASDAALPDASAGN